MAPTTRQRLVAAAFELFDERGYDQTTTEDIAARAGVGRTTLFRTFGGKDEVVFPDHDAIISQVQARLRSSGPDTAVLAAKDAAHLVLGQYLAEGAVARSRYLLTSRVPTLRNSEAASVSRYQRLFHRHFQTLKEGPVNSDLLAGLLAAALVAAHNHVLRRWLREEADDAHAELTRSFPLALDHLLLAGQEGGATSGSTVFVLRSSLPVDAVLPVIRTALDEVNATEQPARQAPDARIVEK